MGYSVDSISVCVKDSLDSSEVVNNDHIVIWFGVKMLSITQFSAVIYCSYGG